MFASIDQGADRDLDGDPLQVAEITEYPRFGTLVSWNSAGDFVYDPANLDYDEVVDSFRYRVSDGLADSETTVYLYRYLSTRILYPLKYEVSSGGTLFVPREIGLTSETQESFRGISPSSNCRNTAPCWRTAMARSATSRSRASSARIVS